MTEFIRSGTIAATNNSAIISGTGTAWEPSNVRAGDLLFIIETTGPVPYSIIDVAGDASITIGENYRGTTGSGKAYFIVRNYGNEKAADSYRLLNTLIASLEGQISAGQAGVIYKYDGGSVSMADPGSGNFRLNSASFSTVTAIAFDDNSSEAGFPDVSAFINSFGASTNNPKGYIIVKKAGAPAVFAIYSISAVADNTGWSQFTVSHIASSGVLANQDESRIEFYRVGDKGLDGQSVGYQFTFSTTTADADPGNGFLRANNATPASVTQLFFDNLDVFGATVTTWLDSLDDSTQSNHRGYLRLQDAANSANYREFVVTGAVVDGTGYRKVPVSLVVSNGTIANGATVQATFSRTGNTATATITANSVTNVELADMATGTIKGRQTAGTGDPQDLTAAQVRSIIASVEALTGSRNLFVRAALPAPVFNAGSANITMTAHGLSVNDPVVMHIPHRPASCTMTIATPGVVTRNAHGFVANQPIVFRTGGALPTGVTAGTTYFVRATNLTANTFEFSTTAGGAAVNTSGTQSGTHYVEATGAMPTFSTAGLLTQGTTYFVGTVVDANTITLSTTLSNANPLGTATLATGSPVYAAATGNDSNNGLAATRSGAFLTIQAAINAAANLIIGPHNVTIQAADSLYLAGAFVAAGWLGTGNVFLVGNTTNPDRCIINPTNSRCVGAQTGGRINVRGFELRSTTGGDLVTADTGGSVSIDGAMRVGPNAANNGHFVAGGNGTVTIGSPVTIAAGAPRFLLANDTGIVNFNGGQTHVFEGTLNFSAETVYATRIGIVQGNPTLNIAGATITGKRYTSDSNSLIQTYGGGINYFPGSTPGTTGSGGLYP